MKKVYVVVDSEQDSNGNIRPQKIHWKDGRIWNITRVLLMFKTNVNNQPVIQYNVLIHGQQKQLYKEKDKWFVIPKD